MMLSTASPTQHIAPQQYLIRNRKCGAPPKFTEQLSGTRHFTVSLSPMEDHLASPCSSANGIGGRREERKGLGSTGAALPRMISMHWKGPDDQGLMTRHH